MRVLIAKVMPRDDKTIQNQIGDGHIARTYLFQNISTKKRKEQNSKSTEKPKWAGIARTKTPKGGLPCPQVPSITPLLAQPIPKTTKIYLIQETPTTIVAKGPNQQD